MAKKRRKKKAGAQRSAAGREQAATPGEQPAEPPQEAPPEAPAQVPTEAAAPASLEFQEASPGTPDRDPPAGARSGRRDFLAMSGNLLVGVCGLGALAGGVRMAVPDFDTGAPVRFALGLPADFKMHTLTWLRDQDVFVLHDATGYGAFSARCTHLGCTVRRTAEGFACPCHGATFDPYGKVLTGPARTDLPWFAVWQAADGRLWADTRVQVAPGPKPFERLDRASVFGE